MSAKFDYEQIKQGDYICIENHGNYWICNINKGDRYFRITDQYEDRFNEFASGWLVRKNLITGFAKR